MGFTDTLKGGLGSLAGDLPKAVLFMRKYQKDLLWTQEKLQQAEKDTEEAVFSKLVGEGEMDLGGFFEDGKENLAGMSEGMTKAMDTWKLGQLAQASGVNNVMADSLASQLGDNPASGDGSSSFSKLIETAVGSGFVAMEVQYNPSSISLETAQGHTEINDGGINNLTNSNLRQFNSKPYTNLSFTLVFDAMNQMDAFMLDASMLSAGGVLSLGTDLVKNWKDDAEGFTVRTQVEGLIASLFSPLTRRVIFCWAGMVFVGDMLQVNAKYTMFNKIGNPIRATVDITIQQNPESETAEKSSQWNKSFTKVFGEPGFDGMAGAASKWDMAKNNALLNFSL